MAGTLVISTLSDGTNSTSSTNCIQGSAKAWCNWNGNTGAIRASYNVSSVTHTGTGGYVMNLTNALVDTNGCCPVGTYGGPVFGTAYMSATNAVTLGLWSDTGSNYDRDYVHCAVFR